MRKRIERLQSKVRLCWPLRHRSPLHREALFANIFALYCELDHWATVDPTSWYAYSLVRDGLLETRCQTTTC